MNSATLILQPPIHCTLHVILLFYFLKIIFEYVEEWEIKIFLIFALYILDILDILYIMLNLNKKNK